VSNQKDPSNLPLRVNVSRLSTPAIVYVCGTLKIARAAEIAHVVWLIEQRCLHEAVTHKLRAAPRHHYIRQQPQSLTVNFQDNRSVTGLCQACVTGFLGSDNLCSCRSDCLQLTFGYMAALFDLDVHGWPALTSLTEQAMDGTQSANSSDEVSEMETVSEVLMHCMHSSE